MTYYIMKDDEGYLLEELFKSLEDALKHARGLFLTSAFSQVIKFSIYRIDTCAVSMKKCANVYSDMIEGEDEF